MATKTDAAQAFRKIASLLSQLSNDDLLRLIDDDYTVELKIIRKRGKGESNDMVVADSTSLIEKLSAFPTREDAQRFLDANYLNRKALEPIARALDIPIIKQHTVEFLRDKIIEATAGAHLRSMAIKGGQ